MMDMERDELIKEFTVVLEKHFFRANRMVDIQCIRLARLDVSEIACITADALYASVFGHIFGEKIGTESIQIPASWWQHFKLQCFPRWAKKWLPVKFNERTFSYHCLYPDFVPSIPKEAVVYLAKEDDDDYDDEED